MREHERGRSADRGHDSQARERQGLLLSSGRHSWTLSGECDERTDREPGSDEPDPSRSTTKPAHPVYTFPSRTTTGTGGSGRDAGPCTTAPVFALNTLPWHGHWIRPFRTDSTLHP